MIRPGPEKHGVWPNLSLDNALLILEWASDNNQLNMRHTSIVCSRLGAHPRKTRGTWRKRGCETLRVAPFVVSRAPGYKRSVSLSRCRK